MQNIVGWDHALFKLINSKWHNNFLDAMLPYIRIAEFWIPLYFFMLLFGTINFKARGWQWFLAAGATVIITNFISSDLIKQHIHRLRPCNDPSIADWVRVVMVKYRPQSSSFTSSHAANHFGIAMYLFTTLKNVCGKWIGLFFVWAFFISYAQIYVGVHYPLDIIGGTIVGLSIGFITGKLFNKYIGLQQEGH